MNPHNSKADKAAFAHWLEITGMVDGLLTGRQTEALRVAYWDMKDNESKTQQETQAAIEFEGAVRGSLGEYMARGLTTSQAVGVLALVEAEIKLGFFLSIGQFDKPIQDIVLKTEIPEGVN